MSRDQVSYIGLCYVMLISLVAILVIAFSLLSNGHPLAIVITSAICLSLIVIAVGFIRRYRWAWYASWVVGVLTIVLGGWIIWGASNASPDGDGAGVGIIGILLIAFSLGGLWNMATSELDRFVAGEET